MEVAITSAKYFAQHARIKNSDLQAPLHLEKLNTHCNAERRRIYWEGKVFLHYYPSQLYECAQAADS